MVTTKEIAFMADVSRDTVNQVLNHREMHRKRTDCSNNLSTALLQGYKRLEILFTYLTAGELSAIESDYADIDIRIKENL